MPYQFPNFRLDGQVAVVTGGGGGIGRASRTPLPKLELMSSSLIRIRPLRSPWLVNSALAASTS
jgi:hypothetical protein